MELVYLPDTLPRYPSAWPIYQAWEENYVDHTIPKKHHTTTVKDTKTDEKTCSICQQKKKRFLSDYIRNKQTQSTKIQEEEEEEEETEKHKSNPVPEKNDKQAKSS